MSRERSCTGVTGLTVLALLRDYSNSAQRTPSKLFGKRGAGLTKRVGCETEIRYGGTSPVRIMRIAVLASALSGWTSAARVVHQEQEVSVQNGKGHSKAITGVAIPMRSLLSRSNSQ